MNSSRVSGFILLLPLVLACWTANADEYVLVSEDEFARSLAAVSDDALVERSADPLGPNIEILRPGDGDEFAAPVDIHITFVPVENAEIDLATLKITYGAFGIDVTDRVTGNAEVTERGILSEGADLPAGKHKLTVYIGDDLGRLGKRRFTFRITD